MITMKHVEESGAKIGRPRAFDRDLALSSAMLVFWEHGFEASSMSILSEKMKMNAPSIYAAFGDKKSLFLTALDLYTGDVTEIKKFIDSAETAYEASDQLLKQSVVRFTGRSTPSGCMLASSVASGSAEAADLQEVAAKIRSKIEGFLRTRIEFDMRNGQLPKTTDAEGLAGLTIGTIQGLSVLARDGASRKKLLRIAETAMLAWP